MNNLLPKLPRGSWRQVAVWTFVITVFTSLAAVAGSVIGAHLWNGFYTSSDIYVALGLAAILTGPITGILMVKIMQLRLANEKLNLYATTDDLTGVLNRNAFTNRVERRLASPAQSQNAVLSRGSLLIIDVDNFKRINDCCGHQQGDKALKLIAETIASHLRDKDYFGRLGGEEFGVFLTGAGPALATVIAERIRQAVAEIDFRPRGESYQLSISIGVSMAVPTASFTDLYRDSDDMLYRAKANGRNRVEFEGPLDGQTFLPPEPGTSAQPAA